MQRRRSPARSTTTILTLFLLFAAFGTNPAALAQVDTSQGDKMIAEYFRLETKKIADESLASIQTKVDWEKREPEFRRQLHEMLGLDPFPKKSPLKPVVTGTLEEEDFLVDKVHFQSRPGLYVTGNFYYPKNVKEKLPTILYVCGHGGVKKNGVSYGNKTHYQHHGAWFARNGYACLTIDTVQLGEIEGIHHGTYRYGMWWWNARGYSSAGVEAWNCIRALDYLETRPEVDAEKIGVTGRSGGGAYSWWIASLDKRIKVAVPVAGITSLQNHVIDGCVEGHCDCMYPVNTFRWDFPHIASLVAPRPLLISNTDKDRIFPLDGVVDVYFKTRRIYRLLKADDKLGLQITEGPHKDTQNLRVHAFHWFNEHLKGENPSALIETAARPFFDVEDLRVFPAGKEPEDAINAEIHETFVPKAKTPKVPQTEAEWNEQKTAWMQSLKAKSFRGWPSDAFPPGEKLDIKEVYSEAKQNIRLTSYDFTSQAGVRLRLYLLHRDGLKPKDLKIVNLTVLGENDWSKFAGRFGIDFPGAFSGDRDSEVTSEDLKFLEEMRKAFSTKSAAVAHVAPRGIGPTAWKDTERNRTQIRRRFMLLGQTLDGMRVWDVRRGVQALAMVLDRKPEQFQLQGYNEMAGIVLYAALFEHKHLSSVVPINLSPSHREGPIFLNVLRYLDIPQTVAMVAETVKVSLRRQESAEPWEYPLAVSKSLGWEKRIYLRVSEKSK